MDIPKRFHSFDLKILKTIGKGTYGDVYLCERTYNASLTIVKDIELNIKLQDHKQDITNEIHILASLNHSNIIKFYDAYYYRENSVMISMEYATHGNLAEYMYKRCPNLLQQQEILFYFCQVLLGVDYIHNKNIIHRDLKAENILLTGKCGVIVKIGDFGISKMLASAKKTSTVIGTPYYLAPELCEGKPYDSKSDVWALGCLLYEMCTHKRAFDAEVRGLLFDTVETIVNGQASNGRPRILRPYCDLIAEVLVNGQTLVGLVKAITLGSVHPIDLTTYDRSMQDLVDSMLSILPNKRPTVNELMGRMALLPTIYNLYLDAGNEDLLYLYAKHFLD